MASLSARRYSSSVANPQSLSNPQMRTAAVEQYRQARSILTALRLGSGPFAVLTRQERDAAIDRLFGVPSQAERQRIEADANAQRQDASRTSPARRTSPVAASQRRSIDANRPTGVVANCGYRGA